MALCDLRWYSNVLAKQVETRVILPDVGKPPFPTFYLLHGMSDDATIWSRRTRIEVYVAKLPLIVVMPDGFLGFYTKNEQGPDYAQYAGQELPDMIERAFPAKAARSARCTGGLSMGGYGALRIALGFPDRFISATSHSGALMAGSGAPRRYDASHIFGPSPAGTEHDLVHLARKAKKADTLPKIRIDCGTEDFLLQENRDYHAALQKLAIDHEYDEFPGSHDWDYWDLHVRQAIAFHARALKIKPLT